MKMHGIVESVSSECLKQAQGRTEMQYISRVSMATAVDIMLSPGILVPFSLD